MRGFGSAIFLFFAGGGPSTSTVSGVDSVELCETLEAEISCDEAGDG